MADLGAETSTELLVGKSIALKLLQKRRIEEIEERRLRAEVDLRLEATAEMQTLRLFESTLSALSTMADVMASSFPEDRDALDRLLVPVATVQDMLAHVEAAGTKTFVGLTALAEAVKKLKTNSPLKTDAAAYGQVIEKTRASAASLSELLPGARAATETTKIAITSDMPLPDDRESALRNRYMKDIERRLSADLSLLERLQARRGQLEVPGSLGQATCTTPPAPSSPASRATLLGHPG